MNDGYEGFAIEICRRTSRENFIYGLRTCFGIDGYAFSENAYSMKIIDESTKQEIKVIFPEQQHYGSTKAILESRPFGFRTRDERIHQALFWKTWQKISWRKKGFWLRDGTRVPIPRFRMLHLK